MSMTGPDPADQQAQEQLHALIDYADHTEQTLLAALLSEAADVLAEKFFIFRSGQS